MKGNITSRERCPLCDGPLIHDERRHGLFCEKHPEQAATKGFRVTFGKRVDKMKSTYQEAARLLNHLRYEDDAGTFDHRDYLQVHPHGFRSLSLKFVHERKRDKLAESTKNKIALHMGRAADFWKDKPVKTFKKRDFKEWLRELGNLSDKTKHDYLATVKKFFTEFLIDDEYITRQDLPEFPKVAFALEWVAFTDFETQSLVMDTLWELTGDKNPKIHFGADLLRTYPTMRPGDLLRIQEQDFVLSQGVLFLHRPTKSKPNAKKVIPLLEEQLDTVRALKEQFPAMPDMPFFRWHGTEKNSTRAGQVFGEKVFYNEWLRACEKVGLEGVSLYGGTKHTTTTGLAMAVGRDSAREATDHQTSEAFDRYCRLEGHNFHKMAKVIKEQRTAKAGKVVNIKGRE